MTVFFIFALLALLALAVLAFILMKLNLAMSKNAVEKELLLCEFGQDRSALVNIQELLHIEAGGIYKRISENREILERLNVSDSKVLSETNVFWLLDAHHQFLLSLLYSMKNHGLESLRDFKLYSDLHDIDNIEIFELVGKKLDGKSFITQRLAELKEEDKANAK